MLVNKAKYVLTLAGMAPEVYQTGFVPNAAELSVVRNTNNAENIMRSWGGNELLMDDTERAKYIKLTTPGVRYLELHDGDRLVLLNIGEFVETRESKVPACNYSETVCGSEYEYRFCPNF